VEPEAPLGSLGSELVDQLDQLLGGGGDIG
jgi:hypothetical protein